MTDSDEDRASTSNLPAATTADPYHDLMLLVVEKQAKPMGEVAIELWFRLADSVVPIIGADGFDALYDRTLHQASARFSWLLTADLPKGPHSRFMRLKSDLQNAGIEEASQATALMLATFTGVLSTLIGEPLTNKILRAAWGDVFEESAQEIPRWSIK